MCSTIRTETDKGLSRVDQAVVPNGVRPLDRHRVWQKFWMDDGRKRGAVGGGCSVKVITVVGARPQFIKAAPVSAAFDRAGVHEVLVHTGQHYDRDMSAIFFEELNMRAPAVDLAVGSGSHAEQTARMLQGLEPVFQRERPDWVLVYGDTNSTLAAVLVASKCGIRSAHVEAGLRSFNRAMPEEVNRVIADHVCDRLFAPTQGAVDHLAREGLVEPQVQLVGDVMLDALLLFRDRARERSLLRCKLDLENSPYVLATIHRASNTDDPVLLSSVLQALAKVAAQVKVVWPLHPRTRARIECMEAGVIPPGIEVIPPCGFLDMIELTRNATVVVTDSGGLQKEAFFHRRPCVTLRSETEWVETVELGWNRLVSPLNSPAAIAGAVMEAIGSEGRSQDPYGSGHASNKIIEILLRC
jgi:UDP-GlcNAc3NAcA epimerase